MSDIHAQLALAYAYGLTFQRAVRAYIPLDELDILPCLSTGVLDALLDHLALTAAGAAVPAARAFPQTTHRHSRRWQEADFGPADGSFGDGNDDTHMRRRSL